MSSSSFPSFPNPDVLDEFFVKGRNLWPDLDELKKLKVDRSKVSDGVVLFLRSTALNEYGVSQYVSGYLHRYGGDTVLRMWSSIWAAEEYVHYLVLRRCLEAMGEQLTEEDFAGMDRMEFPGSFDDYLSRMLVDPSLDGRMEQLIFGVVQEYSAYVAYMAVGDHLAEQCGLPELQQLMVRVARDEMRHCRFNQVALESMASRCDPETRAQIFPQFRAVLHDLRMPQEHIAYFSEKNMGSDLYQSFWSTELRSRMLIHLTHFFNQFRSPAPAAA